MMREGWTAIANAYVTDLVSRMKDLNIQRRNLDMYLYLWGISFIVVFLITWLFFGMLLVALALMYPLSRAPRFVLEYLVERRQKLLRDQLVRAMTLMANGARANLSFPEMLALVADDSPEPLASEFRRILQEYEHGKTLCGALKSADARMKLPSFSLFAAAIEVCLQRGGRITQVMERIGRSLQEIQRLERKMEADTQAGKKVVVLLSAFPWIFLLVFYLLSPDMTGYLFSTIIGQGVLVLVGLLVYVSGKWTLRILKLDI